MLNFLNKSPILKIVFFHVAQLLLDGLQLTMQDDLLV
jgi:hypothetical protein